MTKSILVLGLLILTVGALHAQQGWWLGGSIQWNQTNRKTEQRMGGADGRLDHQKSDISRVEIAPTVGYDINERWAVAMRMGYIYTSIKSDTKVENQNPTSSTDTEKGWIVAPMVRYTYAEWQKIRFHVDGVVEYVRNEKGEHNLDVSGANKRISVGLKPGVAYPLSQHLFVTASLGALQWEHSVSYDDNRSNTLGLSLWSDLSLGLYVKF